MPRDAREILAETEARLLRERGYRGGFTIEPFGQVLRVTWSSDWGSRTSVTDVALRAAAEDLSREGYRATWVPGGGWTQVIPAPADIIYADGPRTALDAVHNEEPRPETVAECAAEAA